MAYYQIRSFESRDVPPNTKSMDRRGAKGRVLMRNVVTGRRAERICRDLWILPQHHAFKKTILSGNVGGRLGRVHVACVLAREDHRKGHLRNETDVVDAVLSPRAQRNADMTRLVYAAYLLTHEYFQRTTGDESRYSAPPGVNTLLVDRYPPKDHHFHVADPTRPSFVWHTEGATIL